MSDLTELEHAVLAKLLEGEHPLLKQLRAQLAVCHVSHREFTGVGFYTDFDVGEVTVPIAANATFGDVYAEIQGTAHGAGFVLYVKHGRLSMLEGYTYDEPWPDTIGSFSLSYGKGDQRDWEALRNVLG